MRKIKKTITTTTLIGAVIDVNNGEVEYKDIPEVVTTLDDVTEDNAVKKFMQNVLEPERFKKKMVIVRDIKRETLTFVMDVETFMKNATVEEINDADEFKAEVTNNE